MCDGQTQTEDDSLAWSGMQGQHRDEGVAGSIVELRAMGMAGTRARTDRERQAQKGSEAENTWQERAVETDSESDQVGGDRRLKGSVVCGGADHTQASTHTAAHGLRGTAPRTVGIGRAGVGAA